MMQGIEFIAMNLLKRERIAVYPADPPRTDWYGQIIRKREVWIAGMVSLLAVRFLP